MLYKRYAVHYLVPFRNIILQLPKFTRKRLDCTRQPTSCSTQLIALTIELGLGNTQEATKE